MSATHLVEKIKQNPIREEEVDQEIVQAVGSHFCRCTGYKKYYEAIREVVLTHCRKDSFSSKEGAGAPSQMVPH